MKIAHASLTSCAPASGGSLSFLMASGGVLEGCRGIVADDNLAGGCRTLFSRNWLGIVPGGHFERSV